MLVNKVVGERILLRNVEQNDCNKRYLSWLKNPEINQFLETRWEEQDLEKIKSFVGMITESPDSILFAIVERSTNKHIGNIKIGPINHNHKYADISYFIGRVDAWGKGYATEAVALVTGYAFNKLKLENIMAGAYESNIASQKVLEKSGYRLQGKLSNQLININDEKEDHLLYMKAKK